MVDYEEKIQSLFVSNYFAVMIVTQISLMLLGMVKGNYKKNKHKLQQHLQYYLNCAQNNIPIDAQGKTKKQKI